MNTTVTHRIGALRELMASRGIAAAVIPQTDPHQSEYLADHWQTRRWFSGFTGSAGTLVVTADSALLWVDSRYFLQAAAQLEGTGIGMMKIAIPGTPSINDYLASQLHQGDTVGIDGLLFSSREYEAMKTTLQGSGIRIDTSFDAAELWTDRPELPDCPVIIHETRYSGADASAKLADLRSFMADANADAMLLSALDEIAWTLNVRSRDVQCNPVVTAYLFITRDGGTLFINTAKITAEAAEYLSSLNIDVKPYDALSETLRHCTHPVVAVDPATTSARILDLLADRALRLTSPVTLAKAVKNETEIQGTRRAMVRDGIALVRGVMEIERLIAAGKPVTEITVGEILRRHRSEQPLFYDESFDTIAGYGPHGAIVHYEATPDTDIPVGTDSLLLVDSGAQYLDGTTDITRTMIFGEPSATQRRDFTLVLKGNIDLAMAIFPAGTRGAQLDILAHHPLWQHGLNYLHGTGHGVGHFLNVHEGPHGIRTNDLPTPLMPGMLVTDEPGLYLEGRYGIRCENVLLVVPADIAADTQFLTFEALTLFPFQQQLIDTSLLDSRETAWLDAYHARVYSALAPHLDETERAWLREATRPINNPPTH